MRGRKAAVAPPAKSGAMATTTGANTVAISSNSVTSVAPKIGPTLVPNPPTISIPNSSIESFKPTVAELMCRKLLANNAPAKPA